MKSYERLVITVYHTENETTEAVLKEIMSNPHLPKGWHFQVARRSRNPLIKGEFKTEAYFAPKPLWDGFSIIEDKQ